MHNINMEVKSALPSPMSTRLVVPLALPSTRLKVNVPSSVISRESMNISMMPVDLSKFIVYFWKQKDVEKPRQDQFVEDDPK